ncbi:hypothetical protein D9623_21855 [Azospirillum brasilense]|uniref:Uncharacterized protein n=1 Tax=Azospirillum brasilense TaxID=192 RepID=A0A0N7I8I4_AZOBR|nr:MULTISPECIES: hypothetical protein [Azospirillum]ALJ37379.1 hypothetical protein AMK58_18085 [Azospirillum brasilense]MDW7552116.1 hypothetical protein [Azospirillum brasilense]MDW7591551.1 hypothetical protein [Azospirillum brasilense]MDW7626721.1 hypothetical protein [Azospirillum brasilense]MDX5950930.1 hypothetical protein [Azospirillum brasilense]
MSIPANADASQLMRIRAEELLERKGTGAPRQAGELAGQFAAMLEQLNGVGGEDGASGLMASSPAGPVTGSSAIAHRLGVGAVSVFAQSDGDTASAGQAESHTPDMRAPNAEEAMQVVQSALQAESAPNFRWLTTLLTQGVPDRMTSGSAQ